MSHRITETVTIGTNHISRSFDVPDAVGVVTSADADGTVLTSRGDGTYDFEAGGGGVSFSTLNLGPYTAGPADGYTIGIDLGANTLGIIREYAITLTAVDFDGGTPSLGFNVDFDVSLDGTHWAGDNSAAPDLPIGLGNPLGFVSPTPPATRRGNTVVPRYIRFAYAWGGDQGAAASATFHVVLTIT